MASTKNLFASEEKKKKKNETPTLDLNTSIEGITKKKMTEWYFKFQRHSALQREIKEKQAELAVIDNEIKEFGIRQYIKMVVDAKQRITSFIMNAIHGGDGAQESKIITVMDKYAKIDENRYLELNAFYKKEKPAEMTEEWVGDAKLMAKYGQVISDAIMKIKSIPEADKEKLFKKVKDYQVKKGTIECLHEFKNPTEAFEDLKPNVQLKDRE